MSALRNVEDTIGGFVERIFGRLFRGHVEPVELARKLAREMEDHKTVSVSRVYVPNEYVIYLSPGDRNRFASFEASLTSELGIYLSERARHEGFTLLSAPQIRLETDTDLRVGEYGIACRVVDPPAERDAEPVDAASPDPAVVVPPPFAPPAVVTPEPVTPAPDVETDDAAPVAQDAPADVDGGDDAPSPTDGDAVEPDAEPVDEPSDVSDDVDSPPVAPTPPVVAVTPVPVPEAPVQGARVGDAHTPADDAVAQPVAPEPVVADAAPPEPPLAPEPQPDPVVADDPPPEPLAAPEPQPEPVVAAPTIPEPVEPPPPPAPDPVVQAPVVEPPAPVAVPLPPPGGYEPLAGVSGTQILSAAEARAEGLVQEEMALVMAGKRHLITKRTTILGRSRDCDIVVADANASRRHAEIRHIGLDYFIVDSGSTNGTLVNGQRVRRHALTHGDRIAIGTTELVVEHTT